MHRAPVAFLVLGLLLAADANGQPSRTAAPAPVSVPRTDFIRTMDTEFRKMDADKNDRLTASEVEQFQRAVGVLEAQNRARALFTQLDTDRNGQLSQAEFGKMSVSPAQPNAARVIGPADLNRDGSVTLVEYRTAKLANFDRMDADKDGVVSPAEMKAAGLIK